MTGDGDGPGMKGGVRTVGQAVGESDLLCLTVIQRFQFTVCCISVTAIRIESQRAVFRAADQFVADSLAFGIEAGEVAGNSGVFISADRIDDRFRRVVVDPGDRQYERFRIADAIG